MFPNCSSPSNRMCTGILVPIRISNYGGSFNIDWKCTKCGHKVTNM